MVHPAIRANYYECHITIEPVFGEKREQAAALARQSRFSLAELHMQKRKEDTPERNKDDDFMTGRSYDLNDLGHRMVQLIDGLKQDGFTVWRYKIELTILDSRYNDVFYTLGNNRPDKELNPREPLHPQEMEEAIA